MSFVVAGGEDLPVGAGYDLALTFDLLHDLPHPERVMRAIRAAIAPEGAWLIKEMRGSGDWDTDHAYPLHALMYGFSLTWCLQSGMSEEGGLGLGTLGLHERRAREMVAEAGFGHFEVHDLGEPSSIYYAVRP